MTIIIVQCSIYKIKFKQSVSLACFFFRGRLFSSVSPMTLDEEAVAAGAGAVYENGSDPDIAASSSSTFKVQEIILGIANRFANDTSADEYEGCGVFAGCFLNESEERRRFR